MRPFFFRSIVGLCCLLSVTANAQFVSATLGINGLTCSMCSFAVQSALERLPFVETATLNLNTNIAEVWFKKDQSVSIRQVVDAVYKAGFSVSYTEADFIFNQQLVYHDSVFIYEGLRYRFLKPTQQVLNGKITLKFLDKKFLRKKAHAFWAPSIKERSSGKSTAETETLYHVTL
jgi:copper chaperone CopZ